MFRCSWGTIERTLTHVAHDSVTVCSKMSRSVIECYAQTLGWAKFYNKKPLRHYGLNNTQNDD